LALPLQAAEGDAVSESITLDLREPEVIIRTVVTFDRAADDFLSDCHRRGFTERTLRTYQRTLRRERWPGLRRT
jgi:hypothetical protein